MLADPSSRMKHPASDAILQHDRYARVNGVLLASQPPDAKLETVSAQGM